MTTSLPPDGTDQDPATGPLARRGRGRPRDPAPTSGSPPRPPSSCSQRGFDRTTVDEVAARAGVGQGHGLPALAVQGGPRGGGDGVAVRRRDARARHRLDPRGPDGQLPVGAGVREHPPGRRRSCGRRSRSPSATTASPRCYRASTERREAHHRVTFERAIARGEVRADIDLDVAVQWLGGLLATRAITRRADAVRRRGGRPRGVHPARGRSPTEPAAAGRRLRVARAPAARRRRPPGRTGARSSAPSPMPDQLDRHAQLALDGDHDAALGRAVQLGQHDAGHVDGLAEHPGLLEPVLAGGRVEHQQHLGDRGLLLDDPLDLAELVHQPGLVLQPAGGVDQDDVGLLLDARLRPPRTPRWPGRCPRGRARRARRPARPRWRAARRPRRGRCRRHPAPPACPRRPGPGPACRPWSSCRCR